VSGGVVNVVEQLQQFSRHGRLCDAALYISQLDANVRRQPRVALKCARLRARQGYNGDALALLNDADADSADVGTRIVLTLERAAFEVLHDFDIAGAVALADQLWARTGNAGLDPGDRAEASAICARIKQMAFVYFEIDEPAGERGRLQMWEAAQGLEAAGRIEEALSAYHNHATWPRDPAALQLERLEHVVDVARAYGWLDRSGQAIIAEATILLGNGASASPIEALLGRAKIAFAGADNDGGRLDVERVEALLGLRNGTAAPRDLEKLIAAYDAIDRPKDALSVLMDLSRIAHEQGDIATARQLRLRELERSQATGLLLARIGCDLALCDICMRNKRLSDAIDICLSGLDRPAPRFVHAQFRQFLATCYAFAGDRDKSLAHRRQALADLEALGAIELASVAATQLANQLLERRARKAYAEARGLCDAWLERDRERGDIQAALNNLHLAAHARWQEYVLLPHDSLSEQRMEEAERLLDTGEQLAAVLVQREAAKARGGLAQLRGSVRNARGVPDEPERSLFSAVERYESAGWAMEAANSRFLIGVVGLNATADAFRATDMKTAIERFGVAETNLNKALEYYTSATMRQEAADTRFMLARHYANAATRVPATLAEQMTGVALQHLEAGFSDLDSMRRQFASGKAIDAQIGKLTFAQKSSRIVELALEILLARPDQWSLAWHWAQRGKSRALTDLLGLFARPPRRIIDELEADPDDAALLARERDLVGRLGMAPAEDRPSLRMQIEELGASLENRPRWRSYLSLTSGAPVTQDQLLTIFRDGELATRSGVCVDWVRVGDRLYLIAARTGQDPQVAPIGVSVSQVEAFVRDHLGEPHFRQTLRDLPEILDDMNALIAPLTTITVPEELLVLCPTGPLQAVPLHALLIEDRPLIVRNPLVYTHSLGVAHHAILRRGSHLFGDRIVVFGPASDRPLALQLVEQLAAEYHARLLRGDEVTRDTLIEAFQRTRFVHFQGHASYEPGSPLESNLAVTAGGGEGKVTAREIMDLGRVEAELISLGACESAASAIRAGDEPLGIAPALLVAGAGSVLAALWRVDEVSSKKFMTSFYRGILDPTRALAKVDALRAAARAMIGRDDEYNTPYNWAAYVLYGDWR
jgi:CHAT domain-containing protein